MTKEQGREAMEARPHDPQNPPAPRFAVERWAALAAGLATPGEWLAWFREPRPLGRDLSADISWMPAALRRRVSPLGRAALAVLGSCRPAAACPVVFASRYGDLEGTARLLEQLHQEGVVSPLGFSLAVHNAAVGIDSMARQDRMPATALSASTDLPESACFEALGWLAAGAPQVLVVCCEDPVPAPYRGAPEAPAGRHAWACQLRAVAAGGVTLTVAEPDTRAAPPAAATTALPGSLAALAFLAGVGGNALASESGRYCWRRHG